MGRKPKAPALAAELSRLTGESQTAAERKKQVTAAKILAFAKRFSQDLEPGLHSSHHATQLYGDDGMPR